MKTTSQEAAVSTFEICIVGSPRLNRLLFVLDNNCRAVGE